MKVVVFIAGLASAWGSPVGMEHPSRASHRSGLADFTARRLRESAKAKSPNGPSTAITGGIDASHSSTTGDTSYSAYDTSTDYHKQGDTNTHEEFSGSSVIGDANGNDVSKDITVNNSQTSTSSTHNHGGSGGGESGGESGGDGGGDVEMGGSVVNNIDFSGAHDDDDDMGSSRRRLRGTKATAKSPNGPSPANAGGIDMGNGNNGN